MKERFSPYLIILIFSAIGLVLGLIVFMQEDMTTQTDPIVEEVEDDEVREQERNLDDLSRFFDEATAENIGPTQDSDVAPVSGSSDVREFPHGKPDLIF